MRADKHGKVSGRAQSVAGGEGWEGQVGLGSPTGSENRISSVFYDSAEFPS